MQEVADIDVTQIVSDVNLLAKGLVQCQTELNAIAQLDLSPEDQLRNRLETFLRDNSADELKTSLDKMQAAFRKASDYLVEDATEGLLFKHVKELIHAYRHQLRLKRLQAEKSKKGPGAGGAPNLMAELKKRQSGVK